MTFKDPLLLLLIPLIWGGLVWWQFRRREPGFRFPHLGLTHGIRPTWKIQMSGLPFVLRLLALALIAAALATPRETLDRTQITAEGIDIVLAVDASGSMAAEDFQVNGRRVNRLTIVKSVVGQFVDARQFDRIGLVAFGGMAYTVCPLTLDYTWLKTNLERVDLDLVENGTAVGSAVASSLSRLQNSQAKSKIIILLTDGVSNAGKTDPLTAARAAQAMGVKVYTIGAGTKGEVPFPVKDVWGQTRYRMVTIDMDEALLSQIAEMTGGRYFRATSSESLAQIYAEIDKLEKTEIKEAGYHEYRQLFGNFMLAAWALLLLELFLTQTILRKVP